MPLPAKKKTWQYFHGSNTPSGTQKTDYDNIFIAAKNALLAFALTPCTVAGSSNGTTAAMDGVDRIVNTSSIVNATAGNPHSWIVINLVGMGAQFLVDNALGSFDINLKFSPSGLFTGGSTTAAPTATDSLTLIAIGSQWIGQTSGTGGQFRVHVMRSSDGQNTRLFFCINSLCAGFWSFERVSNPAIGWAVPNVAAAVRIQGNITDTTMLNFSGWIFNQRYASQGPVTTMPLVLTSEVMTAGAPASIGNKLAIPNEISGEYPLCPVGLWHETTIGQRGRHGSIPDMYFTATGPVMGDTYPASGTKQFVQMGQMIVPGDGTSWAIV
jgi:hypothetical protein